ncbi:MAG TPA: retroviral-like aspartic protease family protein [Candidatus Eremiobacteraceae bacterium]|nr:retroviral-like aspartic protease family protein [Candidatus Eremiobacteraceae bacterium]
MKRHAIALVAGALAAFAPLHIGASSLEDPPPGLRPPETTLSAVLEHYNAAEGSRLFHTRVEQWRVSEGGLSGTLVTTTSGSDYRSVLTLGPFTTMSGRWHGQSWRQDENGLTVLRQDIHQKSAISEKAINFALDHPEAPGTGIKLLGEAVSPLKAHVIQVHPEGGRLVWLFFDAATGLIDREEDVIAERRSVTQYDDFRPIDGEMHAWHHHISDGRPNNDEDWTLTSLRNDVPIAQSDLEIPADRRTLVEFPAGATQVRLPARIVDGNIIVRLTVAGRGLDFLLDSGAGDIAFDSGVADSLHLQTHGKQTQEIAGQFDRSRAIVPEIRIGDLALHDVVVSTVAFQSQPVEDTKIVGLLGFDFFKNAVVRIDYERGTVDAFAPGAFAPPQAAAALPLALDDGVPLVSATCGADRGDHFILDTGSAFTIIFSGFAADHPQAVTEQIGLPGQGRPTLARGVGGQVLLVPAEVKTFAFAGAEFDHLQVYVTRAARALEREDEDGLIGAPTLERFVVYLDYPHQRAELVRNGS